MCKEPINPKLPHWRRPIDADDRVAHQLSVTNATDKPLDFEIVVTNATDKPLDVEIVVTGEVRNGHLIPTDMNLRVSSAEQSGREFLVADPTPLGIWQRDKSVSWVYVLRLPQGWLIRDDRTGGIEAAINEEELARKIASASVSSEHFQLGEVVHNVTQALGIPTCSPCERRRAWMNVLLKKF